MADEGTVLEKQPNSIVAQLAQERGVDITAQPAGVPIVQNGGTGIPSAATGPTGPAIASENNPIINRGNEGVTGPTGSTGPISEGLTGPTGPAEGVTGATGPAEVADADLLAALNKKLGKSYKSLDEINKAAAPEAKLTPEQEAEAKEKRRNEAISYALTNEKFSAKDMESFATDSAKDPRETALAIFTAKYKENDAEATEKQISDAFEAWSYADRDESDVLRKMRDQEIKAMHEGHLKDKYGNILGAEQDYEHFQENLKKAETYTTAVKTLRSEMFPENKPYELTYKIGDDTYGYKVKPEVAEEVFNNFLSVEGFSSFGQNEESLNRLNKIVIDTIRLREFDNILAEVAVSHGDKTKLKVMAGRQGVINQDASHNEHAASKAGSDAVTEVSKNREQKVGV